MKTKYFFIKSRLAELKKTQTDFASYIGITQQKLNVSLNHPNEREFQRTEIAKAAEFLQYDLNDFARYVAGETDQLPKELNTNKVVQIPYMNAEAKAGSGFYNSTEYVSQFVTVTEGRILDTLRGVQRPVMLAIEGDSMEPELHNRDVVIVAPEDKEIRDGKIYILTIGDMTYIKRLTRHPTTHKIICSSDNPHYQPFEVDPTDVIIHGRVISHLFLDL
jgi:phage repressor protein C with HTH and peptisase S24 domain